MTNFPNDNIQNIVQIIYFISAFLFIFGLKKMSSPVTARKGLIWVGVGMLIAVLITYLHHEVKNNYLWMTIALFVGGTLAYFIVNRAELTETTKMIALFNGFGAGAAASIAALELIKLDPVPDTVKYLAIAAALIGTISFSGSLIVFAKLQGIIKGAIRFPMQQWISSLILVVAITFGVAIVLNGNQFEATSLVLFYILALTLGLLIAISVDKADVPVMVSIFVASTGLAVGFIGYVLSNPAIMIAGFLVAVTAAKLASLMARIINRPLSGILLGSLNQANENDRTNENQSVVTSNIRELQSKDAATMMAFAQNIIIVPGYGMGTAQAQHKVGEMCKLLKARGVTVKFAIHPGAGRMPGHMNVLLAEAGISYDTIFDIDEINDEFDSTDVVLVLGANDTVNPSAGSEHSSSNYGSSIFGMPILNAYKARNIIVIKRGKGTGYAGIDNPLFYQDNTAILYGDAHKALSKVIIDIKQI